MAIRTTERGTFSGPMGLSFYFEHDVVPDHRGAVLLLHGYAEHCGRYGDVAERLADAGFSTLRIDYRGHGRSTGVRGHCYRFEDYFDELRLARDRLFAASPGVPCFLVGHSHGALLSLTFAAQEPLGFTGLALSSPFLGFGLEVPGWKAMAGRALSRIVPTLALPADIDPSVVSHDAEVVRAYASDPLCSKNATARWFTEVLRVQSELPARARALTLPILVQQAADDRLASPAATRRIFAELASKDRTYTEYEGFFHEIWFEIERERPLKELVEWLGRHV